MDTDLVDEVKVQQAARDTVRERDLEIRRGKMQSRSDAGEAAVGI